MIPLLDVAARAMLMILLAGQPAAQPSDRLCGGQGLDRSSSSIQEDNGRRKWSVKLSGNGCSVDLRAEGQFEFTPDFRDISRIASNGFFRVDVTDRGVRRQLEIESRNGALIRTWRVDGRDRPYDADARAWFAAFLVELDRRTAIGVDVRLPYLVRQGGVDAVLKETELMSSDYARGQYYTRLPRATKLSPADTVRLLRQGAALTKSDYYSAELVKAYGQPVVQDATVREALVEFVNRMESDYYRASSVEIIIGSGIPGPAEVELMMQLVPRMSSDFYKTQVLTKVGRSGLRNEPARRAFLEAAGTVKSDHYHGEVLKAFIEVPGLTERDLLDAIASTRNLASDYYQSQALERIARHSGVTDKVRSAVLDASAGLSRHYAEQVRRSLK